MTPEQAEAAFSAAYDDQLEPTARAAFEAALAAEPELALRYAAFCRTLESLKDLSGQAVREPGDMQAPDLLQGIQQRLRDKSAGRFYNDQFAERSGWDLRRLFLILIVCVLLLAMLGAFYAIWRSVQLAS